jgi:hypothetical protein
MQKIIERVKQIVFKPRETWETISTEEATIPGLIKDYLLVLAAVPALASFIGRWIIGIRIPFSGVYRFTLGASLVTSIVSYVLTIVSVWVLAKVISYLAPNFGSVKDDVKGFKVAVTTYTPILAAGILYLIPSLGILVFIAGLYGLYLLYMGLPIVMNTPKEKALPYTIVTVVAVILVYLIVGWISGAILGAYGPHLPRM